MTWYHPSYYKKLRDLRRQASGNGRVGPRVTSLKKNKTLDRSGDMGYSGIRTAAGNTAVIGNGNDPLRDQLNASPPRPCTEEHHKNLGDGSVQTVQGYGFPSESNNKPQASSPKQQASSSKPQATSSMIREPRKSFTVPEPRC